MYKNMIVRKKHWKLTLFIEIAIPLVLFLLGQIANMLSTGDPVRIKNNTYHAIDTYYTPLDEFQLRYTPRNPLVNDIMERTRDCMSIRPDQLIGSDSEDTMLASITREQATNSQMTFLGVVFNNFEGVGLPKKIKYKVRTSSKLPDELYQKVENGHAASMTFYSVPFTPMQMCLDKAIIAKTSSASSINITMTTQEMPYPPYVRSSPGVSIDSTAFIAFLVILCVEATYPTNEKYIGINILMSVNGVKNIQNLFSWLISGAMFSVVYLAPIVIMLKYFLPPTLLPYLLYGNSFIVWFLLTIHTCHVIAFGMHITAYFWKPSHGVFLVFMVTVVMNVLSDFLKGPKASRFFIYLGILSPNFLLKRYFEQIDAYEHQLIGIDWSNMFRPGDLMAPSESCWGALLFFSLIGIVIHFFLAVYVYAVRPGKYGVPQSPLFFLQKSNKVFHDVDATHFDYNREDQKEFEKVPEGTLIPGIQIRELKKAYMTDWFRRTMVHALRGIDVDFYQGQITALLGHNGAGKTTMMSILSGLTNSTEGMVFIDGKNVQYELQAVQRNLGLCPQENMVFPDLNVFEQVMFFGRLKSKTKNKAQLADEVDVLLGKVNLMDKKNSLAKQLSGGQKRRMCLAMAVIGDASVLILDEPTSGMDAESKREVWDIILKLRGDKTILISTHDMEEADILGDRIAIIHSGKMRSYGTSMFLKKLYGDGQVEVTLSLEPSCDPRKIVDEIGLNAQILSVDEGKAVLAIPFADNLPDALDTLEKQKKKLGVTGLSVSVITLEQVFLRVTREHGDQTDSTDQAAKTFQKLTGFPYFLQTVFAFFRKKFIFTRKNPWTFLISMILPCVSAILMVLDHSGSSVPRKYSLTLDAYSSTKSLVYAEKSIYGDKYITSAKDFGGTATSVDLGRSLTDALIGSALNDLGAYRNKFVASGEFNGTGNDLAANGFYSGTARLSIPVTVNMLSNALIKALSGNDDYSISLSVEELPETFNDIQRKATNNFVLTLALIVFLAPAVALYVTQPLQENLSGVKQLQAMTGASSLAYWGCTYLFDLLQYTVSIVLLISLFVIADVSYGTQYYHGTEIMIFFLILFLFGASVLPLVYILSFWKKSMNASINLLSITPLILGFVDILLMALQATVDSKVYDVFRDIQKNVFSLFPHLTFLYGHAAFFGVVVENARCRSMPNRIIDANCNSQYQTDRCCVQQCWNGSCQKPAEYFVSLPYITSLPESLAWMAGSLVLFSIIIFVLEQKLLFKLWARVNRKPLKGGSATMDELVMKEAHVVSTEVAKMIPNKQNFQQVRNENIFLANELSKSYGSLNVVKGISFRVKQGECFGLLGVNGAGKSTTFRMLTGEEIPHSGTMYLKQYSLGKDRTNYLAEMGYCPQQDAIIDTLNSWDHLYLFARLRGIPNNEVKAAVEKWIQKLNLKACAAQPSGTYSGGNKRRLNIAMALIGNPSLVLMDEPTTGVDPAARRSLWNTLQMCQEAGQSIILTSHSMEECEALCNRLVIMVKGQLVCVGASQELKQRFGAGYNIHVKLNPGSQSEDVYNIKRRIESALICKLTDENKGFIGYHVTDPEATWTIMYTTMNELKTDYDCIEDFAVLSSTLEQLFIQFARAPGETDEPNLANGVRKRRWWQKQSRPNGAAV